MELWLLLVAAFAAGEAMRPRLGTSLLWCCHVYGPLASRKPIVDGVGSRTVGKILCGSVPT
jgi:hypothetical protein